MDRDSGEVSMRSKEWLLEHRLLRELEQIEEMLEEIRSELDE